MIDRYYQEELRYLTEAGKEFARAHPEQARLLQIESVSDRDPYVERLFEGFAFLTARVREKLDDEFPEFVRFLFESLRPHYLRPVPPCTILEFRPRPGSLQSPRDIPAGTSVLSVPAGSERVRCQFRTGFPLTVYPVMLADVSRDLTPAGKPALRLRFALEEGSEWAKIRPSRMRVYIRADAAAAFQYHLSLCHDVESVTLLPGGTSLGGQECVEPAGFAPEESILPAGRASHPAYVLLHEYFAFREKFLFFTLAGLDRITLPKGASQFELQVVLKRPLPDELRVSADNFRLYCTPAVNLFALDAEPMRVDHSRFNYRVVASVRYPESYELYSVEAVSGMETVTGRQWVYQPFYDHRFASAPDRLPVRTFTWDSHFNPAGTWDTYLSLHGIVPTESGPLSESLSVATLATNGKQARELNENEISVPSGDTPTGVPFGNLTKPTHPLYPPSRDLYLWRVLSHLSHNHLSLANVDHLRETLMLYDWTGLDANRRRIEGLRRLTVSPGSWLVDGALARGVKVSIEIEESHFAGRGDAHLLGLVLREFFRRYVTLNSLVEFSILMLPSQETYSWPPQIGTQALL